MLSEILKKRPLKFEDDKEDVIAEMGIAALDEAVRNLVLAMATMTRTHGQSTEEVEDLVVSLLEKYEMKYAAMDDEEYQKELFFKVLFG